MLRRAEVDEASTNQQVKHSVPTMPINSVLDMALRPNLRVLYFCAISFKKRMFTYNAKARRNAPVIMIGMKRSFISVHASVPPTQSAVKQSSANGLFGRKKLESDYMCMGGGRRALGRCAWLEVTRGGFGHEDTTMAWLLETL